eukprot:TRINITY_DN9281_c0_g1_i1.p1 TRINITY_DN9281_c0_g1~~TRINITY_DN9281_c0_g1_i1.p1  ORF type:complete len:327 (+),score=68.70 TRINITY_DN9281_c0_g1_i1:64-981(+)
MPPQWHAIVPEPPPRRGAPAAEWRWQCERSGECGPLSGTWVDFAPSECSLLTKAAAARGTFLTNAVGWKASPSATVHTLFDFAAMVQVNMRNKRQVRVRCLAVPSAAADRTPPAAQLYSLEPPAARPLAPVAGRRRSVPVLLALCLRRKLAAPAGKFAELVTHMLPARPPDCPAAPQLLAAAPPAPAAQPIYAGQRAVLRAEPHCGDRRAPAPAAVPVLRGAPAPAQWEGAGGGVGDAACPVPPPPPPPPPLPPPLPPPPRDAAHQRPRRKLPRRTRPGCSAQSSGGRSAAPRISDANSLFSMGL